MGRLLGVAVALALGLTVLAGCGGGARTFPTGKWQFGNPDIPAIYEFRPDGTFTYTLTGDEMTAGTYATDSGTFTIKSDRWCKSVEGVEQATYSWTHVGDRLTLTKVSDSCLSRAGMMDGVVLRPAP